MNLAASALKNLNMIKDLKKENKELKDDIQRIKDEYNKVQQEIVDKTKSVDSHLSVVDKEMNLDELVYLEKKKQLLNWVLNGK